MYCNSIWYSTRVIIFDKELKFESLNVLSLLVKFEVKLLCYKGSFPSTTHHLSLEDTLSVKVFWRYTQILRQPICYILTSQDQFIAFLSSQDLGLKCSAWKRLLFWFWVKQDLISSFCPSKKILLKNIMCPKKFIDQKKFCPKTFFWVHRNFWSK